MRCENINCSHDQEVVFNPDLESVGTILSFLVPAWCTFLVVLGKFVSADGNLYPKKNQLDHDTAWSVRKLFCCISTPSRVVQAFIPAEVIPRIVLLLSDQQLITATAIFVAAYGNMCEIDAYQFSNVYCMGGASFLTHQVTVMVIHEQLKPHPLMRAWRMLWVMAVFALVFAANITHWTTFGIGDGYASARTGWPAVCDLGRPIKSAEAKQYLIVTSVFWAWGLLTIFRNLCPELWLMLVPMAHRLQPQFGKIFNHLSGRELSLWARRKGSKAAPWSVACVAWWIIEKMFLLLFTFWFTIVQLLTSSSLDLYRIFTSLVSLTARIAIQRVDYTPDDETTWGFGQILPVMLLALPLFQTVDLIYESRKKRALETSKQQTLTPEPFAVVVACPRPVLPDEDGKSPADDGNGAHEDRHRTSHLEPSRRSSTQRMDVETGSSPDDTCHATECRSEKKRLAGIKDDSIEVRLHRSVIFRAWTVLVIMGITASTSAFIFSEGIVL